MNHQEMNSPGIVLTLIAEQDVSRQEVKALEAHLSHIYNVYQRYRSVEADLLSRWFAANDTAAVDCWQAIKETVEDVG